MATDWAADVKKYAKNADDAIIAGIVRYCGIALRKVDSSLVAFSDPKELDRVRSNFLKKKLGRTDADSVLDAAIAKVGEVMKADRTKNRVTVYYLLADHFGQLALFAPKAKAAATKVPAKEKSPAKAAEAKPAAKSAAKAAGAAAAVVGAAATSAKKPAAKKTAPVKKVEAPVKEAAAKPAPAKKAAPAKAAAPAKKAAPAEKSKPAAKAAPAATAVAGGALGLAAAAPAAAKAATAKAADTAAEAAKAAADTADDAAKAAVATGTAAVGAAGAAAAGAAAMAGATAEKAAAASNAVGTITGSGTAKDEDSGLGWLWWLLTLAVLLFLAWWFFMRSPAEDAQSNAMPVEAVPMGSEGAMAGEGATTDLAAAPAEGTVTIPSGAGVTAETRDAKPVVKVYFDSGKIDVVPAFDPAAGGLKAWIEAHPGATLAVSGYADPSGNAALNADLAKKRAQAVQAALIKSGIPETAVALVKPESVTDASVAKDAARRVEVVVK